MSELSLKVIKSSGDIVAVACGEDEVRLVYTQEYEEGDQILLESKRSGIYLMLQMDDAMGESFVYMKDIVQYYAVPFGEKKICYSPKSFSGNKHLITVRFARKEEVECYKNLCENKYDQHGEVNCYPHASANVETRGEAVFAAKNAINGNCENHSHGEWPYESWGINRNPEARMKVEFGRKVAVDKLRIYTRADFPHDNWWERLTVTFSDGSSILWELKKTDLAQTLNIEKRDIEWLEIGELIQSADPSPFPALTQLEAYGTEISDEA